MDNLIAYTGADGHENPLCPGTARAWMEELEGISFRMARLHADDFDEAVRLLSRAAHLHDLLLPVFASLARLSAQVATRNATDTDTTDTTSDAQNITT